jgi:hypothetical protein
MEAIAHSPSFAKKAGVPQSVGKDYASADKGKTFKRGGDMKGYADGGMPMVNKGGKMVPSFAADGIGKMAKGGMAESKKMVDKEVAFMKKKGAPKSMIKHEMSEMKGMKKGGRVRRMAEGGETDMSMGYGDPFAKPRNYEEEKERGTKNLESIKGFFGFGKKKDEEATEDKKPSPPQTSAPSTSSNSAAASTAEVKPQRVSLTKTDDVQKPTFSGIGSFEDTYEPQRGTKTGSGASGFPSSYKDSGFSAVTKTPVKRKPVGVEKVVKKERVITEPVDTSYSALEARRATKKPEETKSESKSAGKFGMASDETRASVRKGLGSVLNFFDLSKAHEREFGKKMAKGGNVKRMRYGGSPEDGMDMGQPMRGTAIASPQMPAAPRGRGRPMPETGRRFGMGPDGMTRAAPRGRGMMQQTPSYYEPNEPTPSYSQSAPSYIEPPTPNYIEPPTPKEPPKEPPPRDIPMAVPRDPRMKTGGTVKKMAQGGYAKADGVAKKGKTQPKMVKMASGGFVKTADGCAQRGKTKAFQVKMKRGGMC